MSSPANAPTQGLAAATPEPPLKVAPTLYVIIFFKLIKGFLFLAFGVVLYFQASNDLPKEWDSLLKQPFVEHVFERLKIHPESKFFLHIAEQIDTVTEHQVRMWAVGTMLFCLFPLLEGIGMLFRAGWAGWLTIGESAFFVPIEVYELAKKFSYIVLLIMMINIVIVWYLFANRQTLFHHHHKHYHQNRE
jgi:uncharacterized membrane protein (DUF2068 family)